ncbi:dihydrodipicolinate synthase family protein [Lysinibacter cavernae]|uniref:4-hydroxy-tetrahydrodipicolinate synthase n=1 Tax=Lysinibacter cavernae TaxID=1640652 RepID=A0A7X5TS38_9MICO|nr:dihydrodipicolinate synthase family protein [Lysinibacter cavernae]NIH52465.1 4-hydroxy-tetrahydrodipicolinate synthase [Lysinibacter cavernae]
MLSAFPLTPLRNDQVDEPAFLRIIQRLATSGVDSITVLGSTGCAAYLSPDERDRVATLAVQQASEVPVWVGVSDLRTSRVLQHVESAERAGAAGILLAPMSYQPLTENDVFELFRTISARTSLPITVYDNPGTTHFTFTQELYGRIASLPGIVSIKIPPAPGDRATTRKRIDGLRAILPEHVGIGISGDAAAATALLAGCDTWYSVIAGTLPLAALSITEPAARSDAEATVAASERLEPLWALFARYGGSLRVVAAIAEQLGLAAKDSLPLPIQGLDADARSHVASVLRELNIHDESR